MKTMAERCNEESKKRRKRINEAVGRMRWCASKLRQKRE